MKKDRNYRIYKLIKAASEVMQNYPIDKVRQVSFSNDRNLIEIEMHQIFEIAQLKSFKTNPFIRKRARELYKKIGAEINDKYLSNQVQSKFNSTTIILDELHQATKSIHSVPTTQSAKKALVIGTSRVGKSIKFNEQ